ncbi:cell wall protein RBR3-like [Haliotis rubra]|uniref:cell wall protein RBR3-like n=1 Tax=Haliotis rubra TaxID=36100 RepID=UPI001EE5253F|nr:cell wall protein RBR3-like [Haliotis rubra]
MLRLSLFVLVSVGIDLLHGQECSLQLVPQVPIIQVARGNNVTILCDASCYGRHSTNRFSWYDRHNQPIGTSGRVFSVQYNRGMFARLILLNTDFSETGRYTCAGRAGVDVVQKYIDISVTEKDFEVVEYVDDGPRRGDVRVDEPFLPRRRPARDVRNRRAAEDAAEDTTMSTTDSNAAITTQEGDGSGSTTDVPTDTIGMTDNPAEGEPSMGGSTTATGQSSYETTPNAFPTNTSSKNTQVQSATEQSPSGLTLSQVQSTTAQSPSGSKTSPSSNSSETPKGQTTDRASTVTVPSPPAAGKSTSRPSTNKPPTKSSANVTGYKGIYKRDKTAFGKYGVLAFALALSAAILLLYTLILLNVIIPRCCTNRQSVSFREASDSKHKQNGPSAVDAVAMKPLVIEPRPNSPDDGFMTVDLDDKVDPKPNSTTPGEKADAPVSPSSDPGSPSKFVSTFLIGRKPSESTSLGVYLHEGKPGDTVQVTSETDGSQGTSDPTPEQNTAGETKTEEEKKDLGDQSPKENVDTSTEVDTSTATKDTSASSSDLGDLPSAGLKT